MGPKRKRRNRKRDSSAPKSSSSNRVRPRPGSPAKRWRRVRFLGSIVILAIAGALISVWVVISSTTKKRQASAPASQLQTEAEPQPPVDPRTFTVPTAFSEARRKTAQEAIARHLAAFGAQQRGDVAAFERFSSEALELYNRANWIFEELGDLHYDLLSLRFSRGDVATTYRQAQEWIQRFPAAANHRELLGIIEYRRGRYADAAKHFEEYADSHPNSLRTLRQLAEVYAAVGARPEALHAVDQLLTLVGFPNSVSWNDSETLKGLHVALKVTHRFQDYARLQQIAQALLERYPQNSEALMALGVAKRHAGEYPEAERLLRKCLQASPQSPLDDSQRMNRESMQFELALAVLKQQRPRDAVKEFVLLLNQNPFSSKGYLQVGQCLTRLQRRQAADGMFRLSAELGPAEREFLRYEELRGAGKMAMALRAQAKGFALRGEFLKGERALRSASQEAATLVYLVEYLIQHLQVQKARKVLAILKSRLGNAHADVQGWEAEAAWLEADFERAASVFTELSAHPSGLVVWGERLGRLLLEDLSRPKEAVRWFRKVLSQGPLADVQVLLGRALLESGQARQALRSLKTVPASDDDWKNEAGAVWLARCRLQLGEELEDARDDLLEAKATASQLAAYHLATAEWYERVGKPLAPVGIEGGEPRVAPQELAKKARQEATRIEDLEGRCGALLTQAARSEGRVAAGYLVRAARTRREIGDRKGALRLARIAAWSDAELIDPWRALVEWLDRPEEIFFRNHAIGRVAALAPSAPKPLTVEEIVDELLKEAE